MRLNSRANVSVEDHRCDLCTDKERRESSRRVRENEEEGGKEEWSAFADSVGRIEE